MESLYNPEMGIDTPYWVNKIIEIFTTTFSSRNRCTFNQVGRDISNKLEKRELFRKKVRLKGVYGL